MTMVVSGSCKARANDVKAAAVSPSPCSRRRIFGVGVDADVEGGRVTVTVRLEGKSDWAGDLVGIVGDGGSIGYGAIVGGKGVLLSVLFALPNRAIRTPRSYPGASRPDAAS